MKSVAMIGGIFELLRYNTHPATVFMGDAGSQLLGFASITLSLAVTQQSSQLSPILPLLIIGIPIIDTLSSFSRLKEAHAIPMIFIPFFSCLFKPVTNKEDFSNILHEENVTTTSTTIYGLTNNTYYFRVQAVDNDNGASIWSNTENIVVAIPPPTTPPPPPPPPPPINWALVSKR